MTATQFFNDLNQHYLDLHGKKEQFFWQTYMGLSDDQKGATQAETQWNSFLSDASNISAIQHHIDTLSTQTDNDENRATLIGLKGWLATFKAHAIESDQAKKLKAELIQFEADLFSKKQNHVMSYVDAQGESYEGSLPVMAANIRTSDDETVRRSSHQALLDLEQWLLQNGFLQLVALRNQFARSLGYNNFFDYSIEKTEQMTTEQLFSILDDFEKQTRSNHLDSIATLAKQKGDNAIKGHNFVYSFSGDAMRDLDPYVPFSQSLTRWVESFGRLNINYSQAELTLDLLDRKGKYPNGFCHGPTPSFYQQGEWVAAKVNFTSNAKPDQVGSGYDGINTLFHEGGHAAHFANVKMNAPCFSQEFAPTSMAYAETQSMFCDSLLSDGDWLKQYAKDADGNAVPDHVIKAMIDARQPFRAYGERSILVVPYFERALYLLEDHQLTAEKVTSLAREMEMNILGLDTSPRPLMAIPHLLSDEAACAYQGYLLANMAVYQTRHHFMNEFGYLTDNPNIGPLLAEHYWREGNKVNHNTTIERLTGEGFNARYLADECNLSADQVWQQEQQKIASAATRVRAEIAPLNASIQVVDGNKILANNQQSDKAMCQQFEEAIKTAYGR
ncbi:M3 family metallopeptidase [Vibrio sp. 99-8-1]|uniref:M3 family metallopeptidase n=1 Tax=Vibrio sp. 99-8-1 TaxID=2607602 RepID=UPI001493587E|nr:M3 family metallopeptidase [Vibrio sp. 99-8-1]NOI66703.1 M3 family oligoendopeptidase [Vibrio sp. 99-8-1]